MKAIKNRIKSVESTRQITKAMELVASSKLRKAKENAEKAKPYYAVLKEAIEKVIFATDENLSEFFKTNDSEKTCYIIIAGDRGLAGGYNNNLFKLVKEHINLDSDVIIPVGKKSVEHYAKYSTETLTKDYEVVSSLGVADALSIGKLVCEEFKNKHFSKVNIVYTKFVSMLTQEATIEQLLPLKKEDFIEINPNAAKETNPYTIFEPTEDEIVDRIIEQYTSGIVYAALRSSFASECAARRTAMESATDNATEMIENLTLNFNRARQAAITQEITEVVSGSES